ncbi:UNVERIFIED_CONTAM: hypothetical protein FKN15_021904 [Acipenser sinensis]
MYAQGISAHLITPPYPHQAGHLEQRTRYEVELHGHWLWEQGLREHIIKIRGHMGPLGDPPTGGALTKAAMVERTGEKLASPSFSASSMQ